MGVKEGDIIDESKGFDQSCRVAFKVLEGGAGFESIECCGNSLGAEEVVSDFDRAVQRAEGNGVAQGLVIDESKHNPDSCGLKIEVLGGGAGLQAVRCCGNELTVERDSA